MTDHDVRGTGPVLLIVPGGAGHPMGLERMTDVLAHRFTVVTYDPLGLAHGRLGLPVAEQRVRDWSEGAGRVLDAVLPEGESAYVFGTSAGGIAALDLLARQPRRLRHVVAHEPPCVTVLPDAARHRAAFQEVYDVYRAAGLPAAAARLTRPWRNARRTPSRLPNPSPRSRSWPNRWRCSSAASCSRSRPTPPTPPPSLPSPSPPAPTAGRLLHRTAASVAARANAGFVEFPGGHLGALEHPTEFADLLTTTLLRSAD